MRKIVVIGGGAAGMAAAIAAAEAGASVTLFEKNEKLGKKLFITGKGRCNLTNAADMKTLMEHVVTNPKFLYGAFRAFTNEDIIRLIEDGGCPVKTERGNRVFPVSDHSSDVIKALEQKMKEAGVKVRLTREVKELIVRKNDEAAGKKTPALVCGGIVLKSGERVPADAVILATGGVSYPLTGSTGDGHRIARETGHQVTELYPSLVPLIVKEQQCRDLMGLSLKNIEIRITDPQNGKTLYSEFGEMLFTHFGVSGPVILSASTYIGPVLRKKELRLLIDLKPALTEEQLDQRILRDLSEAKNRALKNALSGLYPSRLVPEVIRQSGADPEKKVNALTKAERASLLKATKGLEYTLTGTRGFSEAIVTKGGVSTKDIDPSTMASRRVKSLYFAGELIDCDAFTGGYSLQIAWSTGWLAGQKAAGQGAVSVTE